MILGLYMAELDLDVLLENKVLDLHLLLHFVPSIHHLLLFLLHSLLENLHPSPEAYLVILAHINCTLSLIQSD